MRRHVHQPCGTRAALRPGRRAAGRGARGLGRARRPRGASRRDGPAAERRARVRGPRRRVPAAARRHVGAPRPTRGARGHRPDRRTAALTCRNAGAHNFAAAPPMRPTLALHRQALAAHADRLARFLRGELSADEWRPIRLSYGLYYQLDHTSHMQRIKIPGGMLTADQLDVLADVADRYGRGVAHVTTRQDLQIHWVPVERIIDLYEQLLAVGITNRGACSDSVRNVTACPYAGIAPDEAFDVAPYCLAVHEYFLFNPLNLTLPRKFKIALEGCPCDCAQAPVNDIGLYATVRDGARGFAVHAGGGLGSQPFLARPIRDFIPAEDLLVWCEAIVRVQHRYGERKNRNKARMKYVVQKMGLEGFRQTVEVAAALRDYRVPPPPPAPEPTAAHPDFARWRRVAARPQRQAGYFAALVHVPLGDLTTAQMRGIARPRGRTATG